MEGLALQNHRLSPESHPDEVLRDLLSAKGVTVLDVATNVNQAVKDLRPGDYRDFAFRDFPKYRGEIEKSFGKLPFKEDGTLDPQVKANAEQGIQARDQRFRELLGKKGLKEGTPAFDEALAKLSAQKDDLTAAYKTLLDPKSSVSKKTSAFLTSQAIVLQAKAQNTLNHPTGRQGIAEAYQTFQMSGEAFKGGLCAYGDARFIKASAQSFYAAAGIARKGGQEDQAHTLFLRAPLSYGLGTAWYESNLFRDSSALRMLGDGLKELGRFDEARLSYEIAKTHCDYSNAAAKARAPRASPVALGQSIEECKRQVETDKKLGKEFFAEKKNLDEKLKKGTINDEERERLSKMQFGVNLIRQVNGLHFPGLTGAKEPSAISRLREEIVTALHNGHYAEVKALGKLAQQQFQNVVSLRMADGLRRKTVLPQMPAQVQGVYQAYRRLVDPCHRL